jgi:hypothetical protein
MRGIARQVQSDERVAQPVRILWFEIFGFDDFHINQYLGRLLHLGFGHKLIVFIIRYLKCILGVGNQSSLPYFETDITADVVQNLVQDLGVQLVDLEPTQKISTYFVIVAAQAPFPFVLF